MQDWQKSLKGDPSVTLAWLLEPENPSVRYWTLVDILDCPASDPEVQATRAAIAGQPLVQEIFALQHPQGYWGEDETKPYTAQGAVAALSLLHMLGVLPDHRTALGCDSFIKFCQHTSGGFSLTRTLRSGIFPCTTGEHLPFLVYFGFGDDPRLRQALLFSSRICQRRMPWIAGATSTVTACGAPSPLSTAWPSCRLSMRSAQSESVVKRLAHALLDAPYDFEGEHKRWLTFGVPRAWDLLSTLKALAAHGYARDPRFISLLDLVLARQDESGRWLCGSVSRTWPVEPRNRPSKWVTLDALRVLKETVISSNSTALRTFLSGGNWAAASRIGHSPDS